MDENEFVPVFKSYRDMLWEALENEIGTLERTNADIAFGLVKWLSEDECKEFCKIYEIEGKVDYSLDE